MHDVADPKEIVSDFIGNGTVAADFPKISCGPSHARLDVHLAITLFA
jgi:hypothetical protein